MLLSKVMEGLATDAGLIGHLEGEIASDKEQLTSMKTKVKIGFLLKGFSETASNRHLLLFQIVHLYLQF